MPGIKRILDANANRAREALRVMEDAARFILDDAELSRQLKQLRHDFAKAMSAVPGLEVNRDTPGDVGTSITTPGEMTRSGVADVATAACKRLTEALRTIEEYGKTLGDWTGPQGFSTAIEKIRYRAYELERQLNLRLLPTRPRQWKLCLLLTESLCTHQGWWNVLDDAVNAGIDCVQVREKNMDAGKLTKRVNTILDAFGTCVTVIVNDRPDVAMASGAHGVHLGQTDISCENVRQLFGSQLIIGVSTSNLDEAKQAKKNGADYCGVGPMFHTTTKHKPTLAGPAYLREYLAWNQLPHLAIGGINTQNIHELIEAGVQGIAVSSTVCTADDPLDATKKLVDAMSA